MTCIVALVDKGVTYFAGDALVVNVPSQYHSGVSQTVRKEPKIWKREGMLFGANGKVRMLQLLRYHLVIPPYQSGRNKIEYLVQDFIKTLQDCFTQNEFDIDGLGGNILIGLEGELFTIGDSFAVCNTSHGYDSVGKASEVAIGSLHTTAQLTELPPLERLYLALLATEQHTCVVSQPFTYIVDGMEEAQPLLSTIQRDRARKAGLAEMAHIAENEGMYD